MQWAVQATQVHKAVIWGYLVHFFATQSESAEWLVWPLKHLKLDARENSHYSYKLLHLVFMSV